MCANAISIAKIHPAQISSKCSLGASDLVAKRWGYKSRFEEGRRRFLEAMWRGQDRSEIASDNVRHRRPILRGTVRTHDLIVNDTGIIGSNRSSLARPADRLTERSLPALR